MDAAKQARFEALNNQRLEQAYSQQDAALQATQRLILDTPNSDKSQRLYDAKLHMELAKEQLAEAMKL